MSPENEHQYIRHRHSARGHGSFSKMQRVLENAASGNSYVGLFWAFLYIPVLLLSSLGFLISFIVMSHFSFFMTMFEQFIMSRYTSMTRRNHFPKYQTPLEFTPSISFMGGGQLWMFSIGVGHYIYEHYDISKIKFMASSCGNFGAVPLACGLDPYEWCKQDWGKCIAHFNSRLTGCLFDSKHFYYDLWNEYLPPDAHIRCTNRLYISVTLFPSMENKVVSQFDTRDELIWTIVASCCLPFVFMRDFPVNCGPTIGTCFDGGFSNDAPCLDSYTITVSALHKEADIRPDMRLPKKSRARSNSGSNERDKNVQLSHDPSSPGDSISVYDSRDPYERASAATVKYGRFNKQARIRLNDVVMVPLYDRVWEVGRQGEKAAFQCTDFGRPEWVSIRLRNGAHNRNLILEKPQSMSSGVPTASHATNLSSHIPINEGASSHRATLSNTPSSTTATAIATPATSRRGRAGNSGSDVKRSRSKSQSRAPSADSRSTTSASSRSVTPNSSGRRGRRGASRQEAQSARTKTSSAAVDATTSTSTATASVASRSRSRGRRQKN